MKREESAPFKCHVFVCTFRREGERVSCGVGHGDEVRDALKQRGKEKKWGSAVRITQSGCLGPCDKGTNVMVYPQKLWFSGVREHDIEELVKVIDELLVEK